jgi:surface protein
MCESEHENHSCKSFGSMMPKKEKINNKLKEFKKEIDLIKEKVKSITSKLNKVVENLEEYYKINEVMLKNYNPSLKNYETLTNINQINNNIHNILDEIKFINSEESDQTLNILNIYQKMFNKETSEVNLTYNINREENTINIFGTDFVKNNKDKCKMFIDGQEYEIRKTFDITNYNKEKLQIKLKGIKKVTDMSCMFSGCSTLSSIENFTNLNTSKVTNMNSMFSGCSSLLTIPDISNWDVSNVINLGAMFAHCKSLSSLPDLSKWDSNKAIKTSIFQGCNPSLNIPENLKSNCIIF